MKKEIELVVNVTREVENLDEKQLGYITALKWPSFSPNDLTFEMAKDISRKIGKPLYIHGFMNVLPSYIGEKIDNILDLDCSKIKKLEEINQPYYSCHLGIIKPEFKEQYSEEEEKTLLQEIVSNLRNIKELFSKPIIVENIPVSILEKFPIYVGKPEFISKVIQEADVGFLLDIAHARVSAQTLNMDIYSYIDKLPLDRVIEIHTSGVKTAIKDYKENTNNKSNSNYLKSLYDFHCEMDDCDVDLLKYIVRKTPNLKVLTEEYLPREEEIPMLNPDENRHQTIRPTSVNENAVIVLKKDLKRLELIRKHFNESFDKN